MVYTLKCSFLFPSNEQQRKKGDVHDTYFDTIRFLDSGDTDAVIPVTSTRYSIDALKLPTVSPYRAWYDDGQVSSLPSPPSDSDHYDSLITLSNRPFNNLLLGKNR